MEDGWVTPRAAAYSGGAIWCIAWGKRWSGVTEEILQQLSHPGGDADCCGDWLYDACCREWERRNAQAAQPPILLKVANGEPNFPISICDFGPGRNKVVPGDAGTDNAQFYPRRGSAD